MAQMKPFIFVDDDAITARSAQVPNADWLSGGNNAGNSMPLGIGVTGALDTLQLPNWTLLDQLGDARVPQIGQLIGGLGISDPSQSNGLEGNGLAHDVACPEVSNGPGDGTVTGKDEVWATLATLAAGWVAA